MIGQNTDSKAVHHQALSDLEAGRPLEALKAWRHLLLRDISCVKAHLDAATATLDLDVIAPIRGKAIALTNNLLDQTPGESEINQLGQLLRAWGTLALPEVPSRALQHLERAWSCGHDAKLDQQLASLHARLGYGSGAHWLAEPRSFAHRARPRVHIHHNLLNCACFQREEFGYNAIAILGIKAMAWQWWIAKVNIKMIYAATIPGPGPAVLTSPPSSRWLSCNSKLPNQACKQQITRAARFWLSLNCLEKCFSIGSWSSSHA